MMQRIRYRLGRFVGPVMMVLKRKKGMQKDGCLVMEIVFGSRVLFAYEAMWFDEEEWEREWEEGKEV
jgi:hypothetical protein